MFMPRYMKSSDSAKERSRTRLQHCSIIQNLPKLHYYSFCQAAWAFLISGSLVLVTSAVCYSHLCRFPNQSLFRCLHSNGLPTWASAVDCPHHRRIPNLHFALLSSGFLVVEFPSSTPLPRT